MQSTVRRCQFTTLHQQLTCFQINSFTIPNYNQQDAKFLGLFISTDAVHVSGGSSALHQEHTTVHTASGIVKQYCCLLLSWMRWNTVYVIQVCWHIPCYISSTIAAGSSNGLTNTWSCMYSYVLLMMGAGTAWHMYSVCRNKQIKKCCILLVVICNYIAMHGHMNVKFNSFTLIIRMAIR